LWLSKWLTWWILARKHIHKPNNIQCLPVKDVRWRLIMLLFAIGRYWIWTWTRRERVMIICIYYIDSWELQNLNYAFVYIFVWVVSLSTFLRVFFFTAWLISRQRIRGSRRGTRRSKKVGWKRDNIFIYLKHI
jgi:hypothetical protein